MNSWTSQGSVWLSPNHLSLWKPSNLLYSLVNLSPYFVWPHCSVSTCSQPLTYSFFLYFYHVVCSSFFPSYFTDPASFSSTAHLQRSVLGAMSPLILHLFFGYLRIPVSNDSQGYPFSPNLTRLGHELPTSHSHSLSHRQFRIYISKHIYLPPKPASLSAF